MKIIPQTTEQIVKQVPMNTPQAATPSDMLLFKETDSLSKTCMSYADFCAMANNISCSSQEKIYTIKPLDISPNTILQHFEKKVTAVRDEYLYDGFKEWLIKNREKIECQRVFIPVMQMYGRLNAYTENYKKEEVEYHKTGYRGTVTENYYGDHTVNLEETGTYETVIVDKHDHFNNLNMLTEVNNYHMDDKLCDFYDMRDRKEEELLYEGLENIPILCSEKTYTALLEKAKERTWINIKNLIQKRLKINSTASNVNWNWIYPEIVLQPVWIIRFTYKNILFLSVFSENKECILELPYKKNESTQNAYSGNLKKKPRVFSIATLTTMCICWFTFLLASFAAIRGEFDGDTVAWIQYALTIISSGLNTTSYIMAVLALNAAKRIKDSSCLLNDTYQKDSHIIKSRCTLSIIFECASIISFIFVIIPMISL